MEKFLNDKKQTSRHVFQIFRAAHAMYVGYSIEIEKFCGFFFGSKETI